MKLRGRAGQVMSGIAGSETLERPGRARGRSHRGLLPVTTSSPVPAAPLPTPRRDEALRSASLVWLTKLRKETGYPLDDIRAGSFISLARRKCSVRL